jgi:hypothetical protein
VQHRRLAALHPGRAVSRDAPRHRGMKPGGPTQGLRNDDAQRQTGFRRGDDCQPV